MAATCHVDLRVRRIAMFQGCDRVTMVHSDLTPTPAEVRVARTISLHMPFSLQYSSRHPSTRLACCGVLDDGIPRHLYLSRKSLTIKIRPQGAVMANLCQSNIQLSSIKLAAMVAIGCEASQEHQSAKSLVDDPAENHGSAREDKQLTKRSRSPLLLP